MLGTCKVSAKRMFAGMVQVENLEMPLHFLKWSSHQGYNMEYAYNMTSFVLQQKCENSCQFCILLRK